jgi:hypothetical protein
MADCILTVASLLQLSWYFPEIIGIQMCRRFLSFSNEQEFKISQLCNQFTSRIANCTISSRHRNCLSFDLCRPCLAWCTLTTTGVIDYRQPAEAKTCDLDSQTKTRVDCLCSAPCFIHFVDSIEFHELTVVLTLARAPSQTLPSGSSGCAAILPPVCRLSTR